LDRYLAEEMPDRHSTNLAYRSYIEMHIRPKWANWPLRKLTANGAPFTIEQWLKSLDLAPKTKGNIRNVMAVIFNCAMRWGLVDLGVNPIALVRVKGISRRQTEPRVLSPEEIQALVAKLTDPCRTAVIVALSTGLRCSELFALKWLDFNWEHLTVLVRRAIVDGVVGDVKTKYSQSGLPLDPALAEVLFSWKRAAQFGNEEDWVFASPQKAGDLPLRSSAIRADQIKPAAKAAQLGDDIGWHTFRHTYSSMLRQLGVDVKVQQELLRHADIRTTMNLYTQAVSEQKRAAHSKVVRMVLA
jgi:integrase